MRAYLIWTAIIFAAILISGFFLNILAKELFLATEDPLTGLKTKGYLKVIIDNVIARANRTEEILSVFMIDIDKLKHINDTYGHLVGDEIIRLVGGKIFDHIRADDIAIRFGGDEFLILTLAKDQEGVEIFRRKMYKILSEISYYTEDNKEISVFASIGCASIQKTTKGVLRRKHYNQIVAKADNEMYHMKKKHRDTLI